jgi:hypothetical protein
LAAEDVAAASSTTICKTTIKEITLVLNGRTQHGHCGDFFAAGFSTSASRERCC